MSVIHQPVEGSRERLGEASTVPRSLPELPAVVTTAVSLPVPMPTAIGKYQVLERLGAGAMGVVYKCRQPDLERPVAVKVMLAAGHAGPGQAARFQREARAASRLTHPNIVQIFDVGVDGDCAYFVMEYIDGCSLDRLIGTEWLSLERTLRLVFQAAQALQTAHAQGVIHRDIKPSNILIDKSGMIKLADFGLARMVSESNPLSATGDLIGTPRYMSPEQVLAAPEEVDARTDVYSLGAVMYEMLTGHPPVDGPNLLSILRQLTDEEPRPIRESNPEVPEDVAAICHRAMARDLNARYATAGQLAEAIQACVLTRLLGRPMPAGPPADSVWSLALPPELAAQRALPAPQHRRTTWWIAAAIVLALAAWGWSAFHGNVPDKLNEFDGETAADIDAPVRNVPELLAQTQKQLGGVVAVPEGMMLRDRYRTILEDLTSVLKRAPQNTQARLLRARAYRRTGEYLAAIADLDEITHRDPKNLVAVHERLLANYSLYVLYLGNLNEALLRPRFFDRLKDDAALLRQSGDAGQKASAELAAALARHDYRDAARVASQGTGMAAGTARGEPIADWCMLESDAAFHAAETALADEEAADDEQKESIRRRRLDLIRRATRALRRGLDADPSHVGLLFLKANSFQRLATLSAEEGEDHAAVLKRQRPAFASTFDGLTHVTLRAGCDTHVARAVLLGNFERLEPALDQIGEALGSRPMVVYLHTMRAWLRMQQPPDGILTAEETDRILRDFEVAFETPPEEFNSYFVRAQLYAAASRWDDARSDLRRCRALLNPDALPTPNGDYLEWLRLAGENAKSRFLSATVQTLYYMPVPSDVRMRLAEQILARLADGGLVQEDQLSPEDTQSLKGWAHVQLALGYAEKEDRARVLEHARAALALKVPGLTPQTFRDDGRLSPWNDNDDFRSLYAEFAGE